MSNRNRPNGMNLADALRALPLAAPQRSAWPELAAQLQEQQVARAADRALRAERVRRFVVPAALAAALAAVFIVTYQQRQAHMTSPASVTATVAPGTASSTVNGAQAANMKATDPGQLAALQKRSQDLERWLRETGDTAAPLQGQDLAAAAEIENLIGLVDVELAAPREAQDASLWRQRVDLLEDLSVLRYSNYQLAAGGRFDAARLTN